MIYPQTRNSDDVGTENRKKRLPYADFGPNQDQYESMNRTNTGSYQTITVSGETFQAFIPAPFPPQPDVDLSSMQQLLERATLALGALNAMSSQLPDPDLFIYSYVRREAQLSSEIEGTQSSLSDLLDFELGSTPGALIDDVTEVSNYVNALDYGYRRMRDSDFPVSNRLIRDIHRRLLHSGRGSQMNPGQFRHVQNWIGGRTASVAEYVPPPGVQVEGCMAELERFIHMNDDGLPALIRAGLAHAQFETIHPFLDGNGRVGRMLITLILVQSGALTTPILYLSLYLKRYRFEYYNQLNQLRHEGDWEAWLTFFLEGVHITAQHGVETAHRLRVLFERDRKRIDKSGRRANSALRAHSEFMQRPLLSIGAVRSQTQLAHSTADAAVQHLVELGIIEEITGQRRKRRYVYREYLDTLNAELNPFASR